MAYYSKKNGPAEYNYNIYDKELLANIRYLEEWDAKLRGVRLFRILSNHKNLSYFIKKRQLSERQIR